MAELRDLAAENQVPAESVDTTYIEAFYRLQGAYIDASLEEAIEKHGSMEVCIRFIHADRGIERLEDLKGRRVGTPGYSSTSLTWIGGFMQPEYGVKPDDIEWVVSAADSSGPDTGKASAQEQVLPEGISILVEPEGKGESDLLLDGEVDALFHAAAKPKAFLDRHPKVKRLCADPRATERAYFARTGIFPIVARLRRVMT